MREIGERDRCGGWKCSDGSGAAGSAGATLLVLGLLLLVHLSPCANVSLGAFVCNVCLCVCANTLVLAESVARSIIASSIVARRCARSSSPSSATVHRHDAPVCGINYFSICMYEREREREREREEQVSDESRRSRSTSRR